MTTAAEEYVDLEEMRGTGITARQMHYWSAKGYLKPAQKQPGTGNRFQWTETECAIARLMVRLTRAGLIVEVAAATARVSVEHGMPEVAIADGITISLREVA